jgi:hypothetical protein
MKIFVESGINAEEYSVCEYLVIYVTHTHVHVHSIRNITSGRFKFVSHCNVNPVNEKVWFTGF